MSELIQNSQERLSRLTDFALKLINGENGTQLIETYRNEIYSISSIETMIVFDTLLINGVPFESVKSNVGKLLNVFYSSIIKHEWTPQQGHFLYYLMLENRAVEILMKELQARTKTYAKDSSELHKRSILELIGKIELYEQHYIKKENILFPYIEKTFPQFRCLHLMWSFHDDFRRSIKNLKVLLTDKNGNSKDVHKELGVLFFVVLPVIFREERIIFPVAQRAISNTLWNEMLQQSIESDWCYIEKPVISKMSTTVENFEANKISLGTGNVSVEQIISIFNNLPVDITFVDENDEVAFFSEGLHRIFPRSKAIIGRKVQNCHPPESVHVVNEIVDAFKIGTKDIADFWIQMKGRFIYIRYFAIRNEHGDYKGTLEVSQDCTEIRALQGERRLLDWK